MPQFAVVGSLNMDLVTRLPRFPLPGETLRGSSFRMFPGGKGANQADVHVSFRPFPSARWTRWRPATPSTPAWPSPSDRGARLAEVEELMARDQARR